MAEIPTIKVLLIDDEEEVYLQIKSILKKNQLTEYLVDWVCDYQEGLQTASSKIHDIILLDQTLEGAETGIDLLKELKEQNTSLPPIIMLTGNLDPNIDGKALELGASNFLTKDEITTSLLDRILRYQLKQKSLIQETHAKTHHDALTGLPNKASLEAALPRFIDSSKRYQRVSALLLIDLDEFTQLNETYGFQSGDEVLKLTAKRIKSTIRESDYIARYENDTFAVLLNEVKAASEAGIVARNLCKSINQPYNINAEKLSLSPCIGICTFPSDDIKNVTAAEVIKNADIALHKAKLNGKNACVFYRKE